MGWWGYWQTRERLRASKLLFIYLSTNNCLRRIVCSTLNVSLGCCYIWTVTQSESSHRLIITIIANQLAGWRKFRFRLMNINIWLWFMRLWIIDDCFVLCPMHGNESDRCEFIKIALKLKTTGTRWHGQWWGVKIDHMDNLAMRVSREIYLERPLYGWWRRRRIKRIGQSLG